MTLIKKILVLLCVSAAFHSLDVTANTQFIKYKNYLIPIANSEVQVVTENATSLQATSAGLRMTLLKAPDNAYVWFKFGTESTLECGSSIPSNAVLRAEGQTYYKTQTGLAPRNTYYFRACAMSDLGKRSSGVIKSFYSPDADTDVATLAVTNIGQTSAQLNGEILSGTYITTWFEYGTNTSNTMCGTPTDTAQSGGNTGDLVSLIVEDLVPDQRYYVSLCGLGTDGTDRALYKFFDTLEDPAAITGMSISSRTDEGATLSASIAEGQSLDTWFAVRPYWDTLTCDSTPKLNQTTMNAGDVTSYTVTGLNDWSSYKAIFCAESNSGEMDSEVRSFLTKRRSGKTYTVQCDNTRAYYSGDGPLKFHIETPPPAAPWDDHALYRINNLSNSSLTYYIYDRTRSVNLTVEAEENVLRGADPAFPGVNSNLDNRYYQVWIKGNNTWQATFGCITEDYYNKQITEQPSE